MQNGRGLAKFFFIQQKLNWDNVIFARLYYHRTQILQYDIIAVLCFISDLVFWSLGSFFRCQGLQKCLIHLAWKSIKN